MTRVLVCGGRDFSDWGELTRILNDLHADRGFTVLIEGGAKGADTLAHNWAVAHKVETLEFPADWERFGRSAGHVRNRQMLEEGRPDLVVAFSGGRGTANMVTLATDAGVEVIQP